MALSALATIIATRIAIWFPPSLSHLWTFGNFAHVLSACFEDTLILALLYALHLVVQTSQFGKNFRRVISLLFIALYLFFSLSLVFNVFSIFSLGSTLDTKWFSYLTPRNAGLSIPALLAVITPSMIMLFCACIIAVPIAAILLNLGRIRLSRLFQIGLAFVFVSGMTVLLLPPKKAVFEETTLKTNPQFANFRALLFPTVAQKYLNGKKDIYQDIESQIPADPAPRNVIPAGPCCKGANIVLITVDSLPFKSIMRGDILANSAKFPNIARLYNEGLSFDRFYTNYPSSTEAHGIIAGSVYASNQAYKTSISEWNGRELPTLYETLAQNGYDGAMFMSDDLIYDGVANFLKGRGLSKTSDSSNLNCQKNDAQILASYGHKGDDCNARAAVDWLEKKSKKPFFLWTWFTNTHAPYYSERFAFNNNKASMAQRHNQSVQETDKAIGILLDALDKQGLTQNTIVILSADHGEAFGEHGLYFHGTSVHEEQTHIPLIIRAPKLQSGSTVNTLGSSLDLAPTIATMAGITPPSAWQGTSLFSNVRPKRVFMSSLSAGHVAGYVEGDYKYYISSLEPKPIKFNLANDPMEKQPIIIEGAEAKWVSARIGAFVRARNAMRWTKRQHEKSGLD